MNNNKITPDGVGNDNSYVVKKNKKLNIFAFILCFVASFFIWIYVMNTQNSNYTKSFEVAVEIVGETNMLDNSGLKVYTYSSDPIEITVQGKKSDIQKYSESDFRAYADVSSVDKKGNTSLGIAVETPTSAVSVISMKQNTVSIYVDYPETKTVSLSADFIGTQNDDRQTVISADVSALTITGPQSYVEKIAYAKVLIDYSDSYEAGDEISSTNIQIYDSNGNSLSVLHMTFDVDSAVVKVVSINE